MKPVKLSLEELAVWMHGAIVSALQLRETPGFTEENADRVIEHAWKKLINHLQHHYFDPKKAFLYTLGNILKIASEEELRKKND